MIPTTAIISDSESAQLVNSLTGSSLMNTNTTNIIQQRSEPQAPIFAGPDVSNKQDIFSFVEYATESDKVHTVLTKVTSLCDDYCSHFSCYDDILQKRVYAMTKHYSSKVDAIMKASNQGFSQMTFDEEEAKNTTNLALKIALSMHLDVCMMVSETHPDIFLQLIDQAIKTLSLTNEFLYKYDSHLIDSYIGTFRHGMTIGRRDITTKCFVGLVVVTFSAKRLSVLMNLLHSIDSYDIDVEEVRANVNQFINHFNGIVHDTIDLPLEFEKFFNPNPLESISIKGDILSVSSTHDSALVLTKTELISEPLSLGSTESKKLQLNQPISDGSIAFVDERIFLLTTEFGNVVTDPLFEGVGRCILVFTKDLVYERFFHLNHSTNYGNLTTNGFDLLLPIPDSMEKINLMVVDTTSGDLSLFTKTDHNERAEVIYSVCGHYVFKFASSTEVFTCNCIDREESKMLEVGKCGEYSKLNSAVYSPYIGRFIGNNNGTITVFTNTNSYVPIAPCATKDVYPMYNPLDLFSEGKLHSIIFEGEANTLKIKNSILGFIYQNISGLTSYCPPEYKRLFKTHYTSPSLFSRYSVPAGFEMSRDMFNELISILRLAVADIEVGFTEDKYVYLWNAFGVLSAHLSIVNLSTGRFRFGKGDDMMTEEEEKVMIDNISDVLMMLIALSDDKFTNISTVAANLYVSMAEYFVTDLSKALSLLDDSGSITVGTSILLKGVTSKIKNSGHVSSVVFKPEKWEEQYLNIVMNDKFDDAIDEFFTNNQYKPAEDEVVNVKTDLDLFLSQPAFESLKDVFVQDVFLRVFKLQQFIAQSLRSNNIQVTPADVLKNSRLPVLFGLCLELQFNRFIDQLKSGVGAEDVKDSLPMFVTALTMHNAHFVHSVCPKIDTYYSELLELWSKFSNESTALYNEHSDTVGKAVTMSLLGTESAETTHEYANDMNEQYVVTIPGATRLEIELDSRTHFENNYDYVHIWEGSVDSGTNLASITDTPNNFNYVAQGSTVTFHVTSDSSGTYWGFKADVKGYGFVNEASSMDWVSDLHRHLVYLRAESLSSLLTRDKIDYNEKILPYMKSPIFSNGVKKSSGLLVAVPSSSSKSVIIDAAHNAAAKLIDMLKAEEYGLSFGKVDMSVFSETQLSLIEYCRGLIKRGDIVQLSLVVPHVVIALSHIALVAHHLFNNPMKMMSLDSHLKGTPTEDPLVSGLREILERILKGVSDTVTLLKKKDPKMREMSNADVFKTVAYSVFEKLEYALEFEPGFSDRSEIPSSFKVSPTLNAKSFGGPKEMDEQFGLMRLIQRYFLTSVKDITLDDIRKSVDYQTTFCDVRINVFDGVRTWLQSDASIADKVVILRRLIVGMSLLSEEYGQSRVKAFQKATRAQSNHIITVNNLDEYAVYDCIVKQDKLLSHRAAISYRHLIIHPNDALENSYKSLLECVLDLIVPFASNVTPSQISLTGTALSFIITHLRKADWEVLSRVDFIKRLAELKKSVGIVLKGIVPKEHADFAKFNIEYFELKDNKNRTDDEEKRYIELRAMRLEAMSNQIKRVEDVCDDVQSYLLLSALKAIDRHEYCVSVIDQCVHDLVYKFAAILTLNKSDIATQTLDHLKFMCETHMGINIRGKLDSAVTALLDEVKLDRSGFKKDVHHVFNIEWSKLLFLISDTIVAYPDVPDAMFRFPVLIYIVTQAIPYVVPEHQRVLGRICEGILPHYPDHHLEGLEREVILDTLFIMAKAYNVSAYGEFSGKIKFVLPKRRFEHDSYVVEDSWSIIKNAQLRSTFDRSLHSVSLNLLRYLVTFEDIQRNKRNKLRETRISTRRRLGGSIRMSKSGLSMSTVSAKGESISQWRETFLEMANNNFDTNQNVKSYNDNTKSALYAAYKKFAKNKNKDVTLKLLRGGYVGSLETMLEILGAEIPIVNVGDVVTVIETKGEDVTSNIRVHRWDGGHSRFIGFKSLIKPTSYNTVRPDSSLRKMLVTEVNRPVPVTSLRVLTRCGISYEMMGSILSQVENLDFFKSLLKHNSKSSLPLYNQNISTAMVVVEFLRARYMVLNSLFNALKATQMSDEIGEIPAEIIARLCELGGTSRYKVPDSLRSVKLLHSLRMMENEIYSALTYYFSQEGGDPKKPLCAVPQDYNTLVDEGAKELNTTALNSDPINSMSDEKYQFTVLHNLMTANTVTRSLHGVAIYNVEKDGECHRSKIHNANTFTVDNFALKPCNNGLYNYKVLVELISKNPDTMFSDNFICYLMNMITMYNQNGVNDHPLSSSICAKHYCRIANSLVSTLALSCASIIVERYPYHDVFVRSSKIFIDFLGDSFTMAATQKFAMSSFLSTVGSKTMPIVYNFGMYNEHNSYTQVENIVNTLIRSIPRNEHIPEIFTQHMNNSINSKGATQQIVESPHPYENSSDFEHVVEVRGCGGFIITFDSRCATENGCDYLQFFVDSGNGWEEKHKITGRVGNECWSQPIQIIGPKFKWRFYSDSSVNDWGYLFFITPITAPYQPSIDNFFSCVGVLVSTYFNSFMMNDDVEQSQLQNSVIDLLGSIGREKQLDIVRDRTLSKDNFQVIRDFFGVFYYLINEQGFDFTMNVFNELNVSTFVKKLPKFTDPKEGFNPLVMDMMPPISVMDLALSAPQEFLENYTNDHKIDIEYYRLLSTMFHFYRDFQFGIVSEKNYREIFSGISYSSSYYTFETTHSYENSCRFRMQFKEPDVVGYAVLFDSRCKTENNCDYVIFSGTTEGTRERPYAYSGSENSFPFMMIVEREEFWMLFESDSSGNEWGVSCRVIPIYKESVAPEIDEAKYDEFKKVNEEFFASTALQRSFTNLIDDIASKLSVSSVLELEFIQSVDLPNHTDGGYYAIDGNQRTEHESLVTRRSTFIADNVLQSCMRNYPILAEYTREQLHYRFLTYRHFFFCLMPLLRFKGTVDMSKVGKTSPMLRYNVYDILQILAQNSCTLTYSIKRSLLMGELGSLPKGEYKSISLSRAMGAKPIFYQVKSNMASVDDSVFRNKERIFKVSLSGEHAVDAGGVFNEIWSFIADELAACQRMDLFVKTPNNVDANGPMQDGVVPNSLLEEPDDMHFLGKMFASCMIMENYMGMSIPNIFWKALQRNAHTLFDIGEVDNTLYNFLKCIRDNVTPTGDQLTQDMFQFMTEGRTFSIRLLNGEMVEVKEDGYEIPLCWENRKEWYDLVTTVYFEQFKEIADVMRRGIRQIMPCSSLNMFTGAEMYKMICGPTDFSVDNLRKHTVYEGSVSADSPVIQMLWQVLEEFTPKQRSDFLRFTYGRSRLPPTMPRSFKIQGLTHDQPDTRLPMSHTCFWQLDLYIGVSSIEIFRTNLIYAITHCVSIDTD
ncbi:hypothetical protein PCE1_004701 [Barthelona sp. PCE]